MPRLRAGAGRSWRPPGFGAVPVLAAVVVALVVVGGALVLLGHRGHRVTVALDLPARRAAAWAR